MSTPSVPPLVAADGHTPLRLAAGPYDASYRGGDRLSQELGRWAPMLQSPDAAMWGLRDDLVARERDLIRNNGFAAGARQSQIDNVIGAQWMLAVEPNWLALGLADMSDDDKDAFEEQVEEAFDEWANAPGCWVDAGLRCNFAGLLRQAFSSWFDSGEFLAVAQWIDDRVGPGRAQYATALQMVNPDRLSNPLGAPDSQYMRNGVEIGEYGEPLAYHIRRAHPYDPWLFAQSLEWQRLERHDEYGRPGVLHGFMVDGDGQTRGVSPMASVVETFQLHGIYNRSEVKAAILNSIFAATIQTQSGLDQEAIDALFGAGEAVRRDATGNPLPPAIGGPPIMLADGLRIPKLPVGTELKFTNAVRPAGAAYQQFTDAVLRQLAAGMGTSFEELSRDYSRTNYSSARASLLGAWKAITARSAFIEHAFAGPAYAMWFEEAVDRGVIELPTLAGQDIGFYAKRAAWLRHTWIGPGRGHIDPVKERQAYQLGRDTYTDTLQSSNAEQGKDWRKVIRQTARENRVLERLKLPIATTADLTMMQFEGTSEGERAAAT